MLRIIIICRSSRTVSHERLRLLCRGPVPYAALTDISGRARSGRRGDARGYRRRRHHHGATQTAKMLVDAAKKLEEQADKFDRRTDQSKK